MGKLSDAVFDTHADLNIQASAQLFLSQLLKTLQKNKQLHEASALMVWLHSLRSLTYPEIRSLGKKMWKELAKGFELADHTLETMAQIQPDYVPIEALDELFFVPHGLEFD